MAVTAVDICGVCEQSCRAVLKENGLSPANVNCRQDFDTSTQEEDEQREVLSFRGAGSLRGELQWFARPGMVKRLAQLIQSTAGDPALECTENDREAFSNFVQQVTREIAIRWNTRNGEKAQLAFEGGKQPASKIGMTFTMQIEAEKVNVIELRLAMSPEFCETLHGRKDRAEGSGAEADGSRYRSTWDCCSMSSLRR